MRLFIFLLSLFSVLSISNVSSAEDLKNKIRLLPERSVVSGGEEIWVGIEQSIAPHWHTYWLNAGDSGTPLRVEWAMPEGFEIEEIEWPVPHKIPYEPLLNYGYEEHVILLQKLKVPNELPSGQLDFEANIEVLVCKEECIPEYGTYNFSLNAPEQPVADNSAYLQAAADGLPQVFDGETSFTENDGALVLTFSSAALGGLDAASAEFFPLDWGVIEHPAAVTAALKGDVLSIVQQRGDRDLAELDGNLSGVLAFEKDGVRRGLAFTAGAAALAGASSDAAAQALGTAVEPVQMTLILALFFALVGGVILNLMPCVFPVLSLKALSLVKTAEKDLSAARMHGLVYTAGVILSLLVIAGALLALKAGGAGIGWGFQLQNPFVVGGLAYLLFVLGLNLCGVFEFSNPFGNAGNKLAGSDGYSGSFFTGVLATLVATPCTAPFMAGAIGFALVQPAFVSLLVFAFLGLGLALPYLVLSFMPVVQKALPKPGAWMDVFKQLLAFPMFGAAAWLIWVVGTQTGVMGMGSLLAGMVLLAFAIWLLRNKPKDKFWRGFVIGFAVLSMFLAFLSIPKQTVSVSSSHAENSFGEVFSEARLDELLVGDGPVFVEMTAAWCITCKVNHAVAVDTAATRQLFDEHNVRFLIGDWTNEDPNITKYLNRYGRNGVPLYVYYDARDEGGARPEAQVLPQVLTPGVIRGFVE